MLGRIQLAVLEVPAVGGPELVFPIIIHENDVAGSEAVGMCCVGDTMYVVEGSGYSTPRPWASPLSRPRSPS